MMPTGLRPLARPTARAAPGRPIRAASSPYDQVSPYGISWSAAQTSSWNGVPVSASGMVNFLSSRAKYASTCSTTWPNADGSGSPYVSGAGACRCSCMYIAESTPSVAIMVSVPTGLSTACVVRRASERDVLGMAAPWSEATIMPAALPPRLAEMRRFSSGAVGTFGRREVGVPVGGDVAASDHGAEPVEVVVPARADAGRVVRLRETVVEHQLGARATRLQRDGQQPRPVGARQLDHQPGRWHALDDPRGLRASGEVLLHVDVDGAGRGIPRPRAEPPAETLRLGDGPQTSSMGSS
jgi:hypothetical protein